jgi:hypothetical protein
MQTPPSALTSMMRGLAAAYTVVVIAYFPVASAGYAAFGNVVSPDVLLSVRHPPGCLLPGDPATTHLCPVCLPSTLAARSFTQSPWNQ